MICLNIDNSQLQCRKRALEGTDYCALHISHYPCPWEIVKPTNKRAAEMCGRMPTAGSRFCMKHDVMEREKPNEAQRWRDRMERAKDKKRLEREMLEASPLRANP